MIKSMITWANVQQMYALTLTISISENKVFISSSWWRSLRSYLMSNSHPFLCVITGIVHPCTTAAVSSCRIKHMHVWSPELSHTPCTGRDLCTVHTYLYVYVRIYVHESMNMNYIATYIIYNIVHISMYVHVYHSISSHSSLLHEWSMRHGDISVTWWHQFDMVASVWQKLQWLIQTATRYTCTAIHW